MKTNIPTSARCIPALFLMVFLFALPLMASGGNETDSPQVMASTDIVSDIVRNITGDSIDVVQIIPGGSNPHSFEPAPRIIAQVETASVVFLNGAGHEEMLIETIEAVNLEAVVELSDDLELIGADEDHDEDAEHHDDEHDEDHDEDAEHHDDEHHHHDGNPHTWFSVENAIEWTHVIEDTLAGMYPEHAQQFRDNAAAYRLELATLDETIRERLSVIDPRKRVLVSDHDSYAYYARDYGFTVADNLLDSFSDSSEASLTDVRHLMEEMEEHGYPAIFYSNTASDSLMGVLNNIEQESNGQIKLVELLTGALASPGENGDTYITYMIENTERIVEALQD